MRKCCLVVILAMLLAGCAHSQDTFEYVTDVNQVPVPVMRQIHVELPEEAASPVSETDSCSIYECEDYEICLQTLQSGNLDNSVKTLTGYDRDRLTIVQTTRGGQSCYQFVWASGENRIGRGLILDDGNYHYCVTVFGEEKEAWDAIFDSVKLS